MKVPTTWFCLGIPPNVPPCGADGDKDADAEKHTRATKHATTSGTEHGARAIRKAFAEERA